MSNVGLLLTKYLYGGIKMEGKITRYFKYRKINKYLKSKNNSQYNCLDNILIYYVNGKLQKILEQNNIKVVMTRNTDAGLYSEGATNKKAEDMQKRCKIIEDSNALFTVSIHQNSYTSPEIQGAQVFYYGQSENGKKLAEILQTALIEQVDPDNHRAAKANESYYLLKKTPTPTVIVECGFLSNPTEAELLLQDDYQDQLVNAIYTGIKTYLGDELPQSESS